MRVLVVGGSGFLGRHVLPILAGRGDEVWALARSGSATDGVVALGARAVRGDASDRRSLDRAMEASGCEAMVCLIPLSSGLGPTVVAAGEQAGIERAVFVSTTAIFTTLDASTTPPRKQAEAAIRASRLLWTIIRPTMIYGEVGDRNLERLLRLLRRTPVVPLPRITGRQQPVHVEDCAETVAVALERPIAVGRCYQVAGPDPLSLREMVALAAAAAGRRPVLVPVPVRPLVVLARTYEGVARHPRFRAEQLARLAEDKVFDINPARQDLGHNPRSFADGIAEEVAHLSAN